MAAKKPEISWVEFKPSARETLFDDLSHGRIEPAQAEAKARELGLRPLNPELDVTQYDPMAESFWTLAMAVAWIAWRDIDRVRDVLPSWRRDHQDWFHSEYRVPDGAGGRSKRAGWILERVHKGEAPFLFLSLCEAIDASEGNAIDPAMRLTIRAAREQLWQRLGDGDIAATTTTEEAGITQIPAYEWAFLEHGESRDRDVLYVRNDTWRGPRYAGEVLLHRDKILALWPIEATPSPLPQPGEAQQDWIIRRAGLRKIGLNEARDLALDWNTTKGLSLDNDALQSRAKSMQVQMTALVAPPDGKKPGKS